MSASDRRTPVFDPDEVLAPLESYGVRLELDRIVRLLENLGSPHESYAAVLVAGTNGKGSTAALLASMATAAGYRTGLSTSPHLEVVEERLRIDGAAIPRLELGALLHEILQHARVERLEPPTYFEALTVAAFVWFARCGVDLAVFEVGMGGRLDATNACSPVLSLVSEIGLDHVKPLGNTLARIAREKAGIFRSGRTALSGAGEPEAREALRRHALEIGADFSEVADSVKRIAVEEGSMRQQVRIETAVGNYDLEFGLPGEHQIRNLLLALVAAEHLANDFPDLDRAAIESGVRNCFWPGRLEKVELPGGKVVWLDVAHNPQGAESLARFLAAHVAEYDLLLGIFADKDARPVLDAVAPGATRITLTRPPSDRALDPKVLAGWLPGGQSLVEADPSAALDRSLEGERPLLVCGSIYLVGWVRKALRARYAVPAQATDLVRREPETETQV